MHFILNSLITLFLIMQLSCSTTSSNINKNSAKLTILFLNDSHGHYERHQLGETPNVGGLASFSSLVNKVRKEAKAKGDKVLVLHAGDMNTGTLKSNLLNAKPDITAFNHIKIDAMAIGEHEIAKPLKIFKDQMESANFPFISSNVFEKKSGNFLGKTYIARKFKNTEVFIFGLTTTESKKYLPESRAKKIKIYSPYKTASSYTNRFPDNSIVVLLSHLGHKTDIRIARKNPKIDLIIGGHSHNITRKPRIIGNALVVQAGKNVEGAGKIDLTIENGLIIDYRLRYIPLNHKIKERIGKKVHYVALEDHFKEDPKLLKKLQKYDKIYEKLMLTSIGTNKTLLTRNVNEKSENALGNLIADSVLNKANCDIAIIENKEIKADLIEGDITPRDVLSLHSDNDTILISKISGSKLIQLLEETYSNSELFLQVAGITMNLDYAIDGSASVILKSINGKYSKPNTKYNLCSSKSFTLSSIAPPTLKSIRYKIDTKLPIYEGIIDLIKASKTIDYETDGRIKINFLN